MVAIHTHLCRLHKVLIVFLMLCSRTSAFDTVATRPLSSRHHNRRCTADRLVKVKASLGEMTLLKNSQSAENVLLDDDETISAEIRDLMSEHDPILLFASKLLPPATARDASALYAWCRRLDEITDDPDADLESRRRQLADWESRFDLLCDGRPVDGMDAALAQCLRRNAGSLDEWPFRDMIAGMKSDAVDNIRTIDTMDDLYLYAYRVAGTVGCMLLPLLDADMDRAREPAIALGQAIQLINILRDAKPDASLGRVYLPQDMLKLENVSNEDILSLNSSDGYCRVVQKVADRADELLMDAEVGKSSLPGLGPLFVQIIVELYRTYLVKLQQMNYDNLHSEEERVKISFLQKLGASTKAMYVILFSTIQQAS